MLGIATSTWLAALFIASMSAAIALDLYLVLWLKVRSISWRTWQATKKHPTLIIAGCLATLLVCLGLHDSFWLACLAAWVGGHLFGHW